MDSSKVLPQWLSEIARREPNTTLIVEADSGREATRAQLNDLVLRWAAVLDRLGVQAGDTVLTMLHTGVDATAVWLAIAWLRAMDVPVNTDYRGAMLRYAVNDSAARVAIVAPDMLQRIADIRQECPELSTIIVLGEHDDGAPDGLSDTLDAAALLDQSEPLSGLTPPEPHDVAAIIYTSGTTGPSKGVIVPWAQLYTQSVWSSPSDDLRIGGVAYAPFPFYHTSPRALFYRMTLAEGRTIYRRKLSVSNYWADVRKHGCTYGQLLGSMARMLMQAPALPDDSSNPMEYVVLLPMISDAAEFELRFGVRAGTLFTMTETSVPLSVSGPWVDTASCGSPRPGCDVRLVDANDYEVPVGSVGELIVRTDDPWTLNAGYWRKPQETARAWRNGWFHTGDAFRRDEDGKYFFVDRFKDAIRRRGENISSMEVEALVQLHPQIDEAAAIGVPSEVEEEDVMVFATLKPGAELTEDELWNFLQDKMPKFMMPRYISFTGSFPKTPTMKIKKNELRQLGVSAQTWRAPALR